MYNPWVRSEWSWLMCTCTAGFYTFHLGQFCHWCWLWNEAELCFLEWGRIDFYMCNDLKTACYICFAFVVTVGVVRSSPGLLWNDLKCATALHDRCLQVVQCTHSFTQLIPARVVQCTHSFTLLIPTRVETWESVWWSVCLEACWQKVANTSASQFSWSVRLSGSLLTQSGKHFCVAIFMDINCVTNVSSATLFPLMPVRATLTLLWRCRGVEKASCVMFFSSRLHPAKFEFIMTDNLHCGGGKKTSLAVSVIIVQGQW